MKSRERFKLLEWQELQIYLNKKPVMFDSLVADRLFAVRGFLVLQGNIYDCVFNIFHFPVITDGQFSIIKIS
jgi:hypothetical protein